VAQKFDVIIIGSGPGALAAAYKLAKKKQVAIVEADAWGGTCPNRGCDPKKVLYAATHARQAIQQLHGHGFTNVPSINWSQLMTFKETFTQPVSVTQKQGLTAANITTLTGKAAFKNAQTITVGTKEYQAQTFILATGQQPALLDIPGKEYFKTSTDFLSFPQLPPKLVFVGGGYISFELANIANSCGSEVHVLHHNEQPLKGFDEEFVQSLVQQMTQQGIHFHFNESVERIAKQKEQVVLSLTTGGTLATDAVICGIGRIPALSGLNLAAAGVDYSKKGVEVNEYLQTANQKIYALGDCLAKKQPKLTPISSYEGDYLADLLMGVTTQPIAYPSLPTIVFCLPQLAQVGMTTAEAVKNEAYEISTLDMTHWFTYQHLNEAVAESKIIKEKASDKLVGAAVLSNEAAELINLLTLMIDQQIPAEAIGQQIMLYPTGASDLSYLLEG